MERLPPQIVPPMPASTAPEEAEAGDAQPPAGGCASAPKAPRLEPTRYGDWEMNGKCIDF